MRARVAELEAKLDEAQAAWKKLEAEARQFRDTTEQLSRHRCSQAQAHFDALVEALKDEDSEGVLDAAKQMLALVVPPPTVEEVRGLWQEILNTVRPQSPALEALLRSCIPAAVENGNTIVLQFAHDLHRSKASESRNKAVIEKVISEILGQPIEIRCILEKETRDW